MAVGFKKKNSKKGSFPFASLRVRMTNLVRITDLFPDRLERSEGSSLQPVILHQPRHPERSEGSSLQPVILSQPVGEIEPPACASLRHPDPERSEGAGSFLNPSF